MLQFKLLNLLPEIDLDITPNPIACNTYNTGDVTLRANSEVDGLPVSTKEELHQLNTNLDDTDVMTAMCSSLQIVAGKDTIDTTKKVLRRNNKNCFANYKNILKLIMVAVRKNSFIRSATQQEVESAIKVWLRNAHDRNGGRKARSQNSNK
ncbi:hypothetical protein RN001_014059 [Aquatica leii]|uniref:DUF4806 domain-containing protein n=1 Tax=Aquatica leii TaxID=1421715 RepID=A0AAN7PRC4_9COLE|nr:hypothetical protein RN001_014059 [Aquatica leii]